MFGDSPQRSSVSEEQKSWLENSDATRLVQAYQVSTSDYISCHSNQAILFQNELTNFIDTCTAKRRGRKRLYPPGIMLHIHEHAKQRYCTQHFCFSISSPECLLSGVWVHFVIQPKMCAFAGCSLSIRTRTPSFHVTLKRSAKFLSRQT